MADTETKAPEEKKSLRIIGSAIGAVVCVALPAIFSHRTKSPFTLLEAMIAGSIGGILGNFAQGSWEGREQQREAARSTEPLQK